MYKISDILSDTKYYELSDNNIAPHIYDCIMYSFRLGIVSAVYRGVIDVLP